MRACNIVNFNCLKNLVGENKRPVSAWLGQRKRRGSKSKSMRVCEESDDAGGDNKNS